MELYIKHEDEIYKVHDICMCTQCQERGMPELKVTDLHDNDHRYIQVCDLFLDEYELSDKPIFYKKIKHHDVVEFLRREDINIEWLVALNRWLNSHINFLKSTEDLEKYCGRR